MDLCSIYGDTNTQLLNKMINNVFDKQPHYWQDLTQAIKGIVEVHVHVCMYVCDL